MTNIHLYLSGVYVATKHSSLVKSAGLRIQGSMIRKTGRDYALDYRSFGLYFLSQNNYPCDTASCELPMDGRTTVPEALW